MSERSKDDFGFIEGQMAMSVDSVVAERSGQLVMSEMMTEEGEDN